MKYVLKCSICNQPCERNARFKRIVCFDCKMKKNRKTALDYYKKNKK